MKQLLYLFVKPKVLLVLFFGVPISHYVVYISVLSFYELESTTVKTALIGGTLFLTISFAASYGLVRLKDNLATRVFYIFSSLWLGILTNLVMAFAAGWAIILVAVLTGGTVNDAVIGTTAILGAFAYTGYGVYNSLSPRPTKLRVSIPGLPETWVGRTLVQVSDLHLGRIWGRSHLKKIIAMINKAEPDFVCITGDLFDGQCVALAPFADDLNGIKAPLGVFFITGNHDTYLGVERIYGFLRAKTAVRPLRNELIVLDGIQVIGLSYPSTTDEEDIAEALNSLSEFDPKRPSILLYHKPIGVGIVRAHGVSLQLSGHTHSGQFRPFTFLARVRYKGYHYGLKHAGDLTVYTSSGLGSWGPVMRTGNRPEVVVISFEQGSGDRGRALAP